MTIYTEVFGGNVIAPSEVSYSSIELADDTQLYWPLDAQVNVPLVTRIMDVLADDPDLKLLMPDARNASNGETVLFNNVGAETFQVLDVEETQLINIPAGTQWQLYLTDNSTEAGTWVALQYGAAISTANASQLAGTGLVAVGGQLKAAMPIIQFNSNYDFGVSDRAYTYDWIGTGAGDVTLTDPGTVLNNWFVGIINSGGGTLTVTCDGAFTIDGLSAKAFPPNSSGFIICNGTNYSTLAFNGGTVSNFDYTVINVPGTGNYTLAGSELNRIGYQFTGILTGSRNIIVPAVAQEYWVSNETTGAYDLTVKTAAGTGVVVAANARRILYCDGTNVVDADNSNLSTPIAIAQGGTGSTTAGGALINLGGTTVGIGVFTAADGAAAYAALGPLDGGEF